MSGHPGATDRELTLAQLKQQRNLELPQWLLRYSEIRGRYIQFSSQSPQNERITADQLNSIENAIKVRRKMLDALHEDSLLARKAAEEESLRKQIAKDAKLKKSTGDPWGDIDKALAVERGAVRALHLSRKPAPVSRAASSPSRARWCAAPPSATSRMPSVSANSPTACCRASNSSSAPACPFTTSTKRSASSTSLARMREWLGPDHPVVRKLLSKESPAALAKRLVAETKLADPAVRLELWKGGSAAIAASTDPMIVLARSVDADARAVRKAYEDGVEAPMRSATERIAKARFATLGTSVYPDATFTLRLNYGTVQGWNENGKPVEPFTRLSRAFERATGSDPFLIPESWQRVKDKLDMNTPFNLSTNNDIVGGNSGSALINAKAEIVGLIFDGNIHSVSGAYWFDTEKNRAVAVHPGDHARGDVEGLWRRRVDGRAHEVMGSGPVSRKRGLTHLLAGHHLEVDPHFVEHHQRPHRDAERLEPELRLLQRKLSARRERAVLALERHRHAHVAHLVLDGDLHAHVEAFARRDDIGGTQSNLRILLAVEQRLRQHVLARAVARALRHAGRKVGAGLLAHGGLVDGEFVHRNPDVEARLRESSATNTMPERWCDAMTWLCPSRAMAPPRYTRICSSDSSPTTWYSCAPTGAAVGSAGAGAGGRCFARAGGLSDTPTAPIARGPQQRLEAGTVALPTVYS